MSDGFIRHDGLRVPRVCARMSGSIWRFPVRKTYRTLWFVVCTVVFLLSAVHPQVVRASSPERDNGSRSSLPSDSPENAIKENVGPDVSGPLTVGAFNKTSPGYGSTMVSVNPTLSWTASSGATTYDYCIDTSNDNVCSGNWTIVGNNIQTVVYGLTPNTVYYWQVRASTSPTTPGADANNGIWFKFTTAPLPGAFGKISPGNGAINAAVPTVLSWSSSSNATSYEYCIDGCYSGNGWSSTGTSRSVSLNLEYSRQYSWQIRAIGPGGITYANGGTGWSFTTWPAAPGYFNKGLPNDCLLYTSPSPRD